MFSYLGGNEIDITLIDLFCTLNYMHDHHHVF
jgi:hypothetical protein